ncbi:hypothetical protein DFH08DRAFT_810039 [Mycena albidolilacea]|uniref:Uncharacterized protein n=1 Tax=Mycena albidolilacea TaxID=1033008 RepID=A0AAD6ZYT3_9AGAR|nr:hypothetical protein DFH08DRAFT_810039 [Mycena albidolilacea]
MTGTIWRIVITGTGTGGTAFLSGTGEYYFQVSWIDFGWYTDGLGTCQYLQEGPVNTQDSDQNLVDADDGWATSPMWVIVSVIIRTMQERVPHQRVDPSRLDTTSSLQTDGSKPQNAGQEWILRQNDPLVDYLKDAFITNEWADHLLEALQGQYPCHMINQQPHSDIHAQREVMIEYRRISMAQGSSGIKWFQGWTSHQVTLGG